jgi:Flp pilus assembly protein TadD
MQSRLRVAAISAVVVAASFVIYAGAQSSQSIEIQLQLGNLLFEQGRYFDALDAYQRALGLANDSARDRRLARMGVVRTALRTAEFALAIREATTLVKSDPTNAESMTLYADALWSAGLFDDA